MLRNLEAERVRAGMTKKELAKKLNVSSRTYSNWLYEETDVPSSKLKAMSALFGVTIDYLVGLKNQ